ncbi:hypothetical protein EWM64_g2371 [Hericium alpestre]|uniref:Uncharacterized protein n=1 Tax=Hericium alpestre TaxID=135208 RepID=A0A4Z0A5P8_9AGAM|nr:hypothetical protein EWM64_g2371 [Hericium alpestre]
MIFAKSTYILLCKRMSSMTLVLLGATVLISPLCSGVHVLEAYGHLQVFLGDAIVTWRAWLILDRKRRVLILPGFFLLTSLAFGLIHVTSGDRIVGGLQTVLSGCDPLFCLLTTATNASSTLLIAWKTWKHRKDVKRYLNSGTRKTQVGKVLILLLESGSIYCMITAICGISFWVNAAMNSFLKSLLIQVTVSKEPSTHQFSNAYTDMSDALRPDCWWSNFYGICISFTLRDDWLIVSKRDVLDYKLSIGYVQWKWHHET